MTMWYLSSEVMPRVHREMVASELSRNAHMEHTCKKIHMRFVTTGLVMKRFGQINCVMFSDSLLLILTVAEKGTDWDQLVRQNMGIEKPPINKPGESED